jgi:hypothetical protein
MQLIFFDIETVPLPFDSFSDSQQEYLLRNAKDDAEIERRKSEMGLSPFTARIVCIGLAKATIIQKDEDFSVEKKVALCTKPTVKKSSELRMFKKGKNKDFKSFIDDEGVSYYLADEKWIVETFWNKLKENSNCTLVSFNGRNFDAPFLMLRSALLGIRPTRNLMEGTRYNYAKHIDLLDELTYFNASSYAATRRFNFDFYSRAFGIPSPKGEGIDGSKVPDYFNEGKIYSIAKYCMRDVIATYELFKVWNKYLNFKNEL